MSGFQYKAFISYSHQDEHWAKWLHKALESYRIPRRLRGGEIPERLYPVFRDKDELSSAANLNENVRTALQNSESLIVICSPASAKSLWVNEEIRIFRSQEGGDRVFAMIVDGSATTGHHGQTCFPPALLEDGIVESHEPLAADPRKWADGKTLAKLKLVAGILGLRLDDLRQRDLKRRRRWQALGSLTLVAAIVLGVVTTLSIISEQRERENAENMATFVVELGEELKSEVDLDTLGKIGSTATRYLQDLDPEKLTPETSIKVGLALRQLGHVNMGQGRLPESLTAYQRSLDLFRELAEKHPDRLDILFELAQAEFYVGNYHYEQEDIEQAWAPLERYMKISKYLYSAEPDNRKWLLEVSYGTVALLAMRIESGQAVNQELLDDADEAVDLARKTLQSWSDNSEVISHYSNALAWAADAEFMACNLQTSIDYRRETLDMALEAAHSDPSSNDLRQSLAYAHTGMSSLHRNLGELVEAERHSRSSLDILNELATKDPSNMRLSSAIASRKQGLAVLLMNTQRLETAVSLMHEVKMHFEPLPSISDSTNWPKDFSDFILDFADLLTLMGDEAQAKQLLSSLSEVIVQRISSGENDRNLIFHTALLRHLWFELNQIDLAAELPVLLNAELESLNEYQNCYYVDLSARLAIVEGNRAVAKQHVDYLQTKNYREPGFIRFCKRYELCPE